MPAEGQQTTRQQYVYPHGPPNPGMTAQAMAALGKGQLKQGWFFEGWPVSNTKLSNFVFEFYVLERNSSLCYSTITGRLSHNVVHLMH